MLDPQPLHSTLFTRASLGLFLSGTHAHTHTRHKTCPLHTPLHTHKVKIYFLAFIRTLFNFTHTPQPINLPQQELHADSLGEDAESEISTYISQSCNLSQQELLADSFGEDVESEIPTYLSQSTCHNNSCMLTHLVKMSRARYPHSSASQLATTRDAR